MTCDDTLSLHWFHGVEPLVGNRRGIVAVAASDIPFVYELPDTKVLVDGVPVRCAAIETRPLAREALLRGDPVVIYVSAEHLARWRRERRPGARPGPWEDDE